MSEAMTAREVIGRTLFREVPAQADGEDLDDVTDMVLAALRQHGFIILPLAKLGALEQRLSAMHDMVQAIGPALADLQAAALKDG